MREQSIVELYIIALKIFLEYSVMKKILIFYVVLFLGMTGCGKEEEGRSLISKDLQLTEICVMDSEDEPRWFSDEENISAIKKLLKDAEKTDLDPLTFEADAEGGLINGYVDKENIFFCAYYDMDGITYLVDDYGVYTLKHKKKYKEEQYLQNFIKALPISTENPEEELQEYPCGIEKECVVLTREEMPEILPLEDFSVYENLNLLPEEIQKVLYEEGTFFEVYNQKEYTKNNFDGTHYMDLEPFEAPEWLEYMVFDFDHDGERELAVVLKPVSSGEGVEIFDVQEEKVYAYSVVYRGFLRPQTDGTVTGSSGASVNDQYYFEFDKNQVREKMIAQQDVQDYQIGTQKVSEDEYYKFLEERYWQTEIEIPWSSKTLDEVLFEKKQE